VRTAVPNLGEEPAAAWRAGRNGAISILGPGHVGKGQTLGSDVTFYWIHTIDQKNRTQWLGINVSRNWLNPSAYAGVTRVCVGRVMIDRTNSETLVVRPGISVNFSISWTFG
jgi:hypothetical protein